MRVMIVEDHSEMRRMISGIVKETLGSAAELLAFTGGEEASWSAVHHRPDLLLLDIELGAMNGFEVMERIRSLYPLLPVIIITSHHASAYKAKAELMRADGFLTKDHLSDLAPLIHRCISHPQGGSPS